jgi:hypothetical protein
MSVGVCPGRGVPLLSGEEGLGGGVGRHHQALVAGRCEPPNFSSASRSPRPGLLVQDPSRRQALWTPRVWPGGLLIEGEIAGTWRRAETVMTVQPWRPLSRAERDAVTAEAESVPLPDRSGRRIVVRWEG